LSRVCNKYNTNSSVLLNDLTGNKDGRKEGKCRDLMYNIKIDSISLVCHTNRTKKDEKRKTKTFEQLDLCPKMVLKIREISPKR